jgi:hypothetical protein
MQDGSLLGDIDLFAPKHGVNTGVQAGFLGELQEKLERCVRDAILRVIQIDAQGLDGQAFAARRIIREQLAKMQFPDLLEMGFEGLPSRALSEGWDWSCHVHCPFDAGWSRGARGRPGGRLLS